MASYKDITSSGGNGILPLEWDVNVPKYDPSSFYSWEQDNIPLWSLERRGNILYNAMGFPGGNPEGITFVLSSAGNVDESNGVYDSIADIVERIPKRLKFPVLVEICTYGDLGTLDLGNITCEGDGILEFRNRAFFEDTHASSQGIVSLTGGPDGASNFINNVYSLEASSDMINASSTRLGVIFGDTVNWQTHGRFITAQGPDTDREMHNLTVHISSGTGVTPFTITNGDNGKFKFDPYSPFQDRSISALDASAYYGSSINSFMRGTKREVTYTQGQSTLVGYGNYFSKVRVKDCQGSVIFRNILVDTASGVDNVHTDGTMHIEEDGWEIDGSEVILDNTAAFRAFGVGYHVKNSRIKLTGHMIAWRNYTKAGKTNADRTADGTGMLAVNTDILFDATAYPHSRKSLLYFGKSKRGMDLRNSTVRGGIYWATASGMPNGGSTKLGASYNSHQGTSYAALSGAGGDLHTTILHFSECNENGLHLEGTDFEFKGRLSSYLNQVNGIEARRSQLRLAQFTVNHNSEFGIRLEGTQLIYGINSDLLLSKPDAYAIHLYCNTSFANGANDTSKRVRARAQFHVDSNNQNLLVDKASSVSPFRVNAIPVKFGRWGGSDWLYDTLGTASSALPANHYGATPFRAGNKPGIVVSNNSSAEIVHLQYAVNSTDTCKGKVAIASNGSTLFLRGSSAAATTFNYYPVNTVLTQFRSWLTAGVVAISNSKVEITGPTKTARFGVPFLAEDNSQFVCKPPTLVGTDNILDISGYTLLTVSSNHTSLEVHATRSCLVANKKSGIVFYAVGGKTRSTSNGSNVLNSVDVFSTEYADTLLVGDHFNQFLHATSGGYVKMYPNAFTSAVATLPAVQVDIVNAFDPTKRFILPATEHAAHTTGGMCVRAVMDSFVDVNLVNFHMFTAPSSLSGAYYNYAGSGCEYCPDAAGDSGGGNTTPPGGTGFTEVPAPPGGGLPPGMFEVGGGGTGGGPGELEDWTAGRIKDNPGSTNTFGTNSTAAGEGHSTYITAGKGNNSAFMNLEHPTDPTVIGDEMSTGARRELYGTDADGNDIWSQIDWETVQPSCMGSQIHIWNIADSSRIHAANCLLNGVDPETHCLNTANYHGPTGKWFNGVALDYYGLGGRRTSYGALGNAHHNNGIFRLMLSTRGDLKTFYSVSSLSSNTNVWKDTEASGGCALDQINGAGYMHWTQCVRPLDGSDERRLFGQDNDYPEGDYQTSSAGRVFGWGYPAQAIYSGVGTIQSRMSGFSAYNALSSTTPDTAFFYASMAPVMPMPPLHMEWQGYLRNFFDQTASNVWQNTKHLSEDKVNGVSIYRSHRGTFNGGEGRDGDTKWSSFGVGVRSLNLFDLDRVL